MRRVGDSLAPLPPEGHDVSVAEATGARPVSMKGREIVVTLVIALVPRVAAAQTIRGTIVDSASSKGVAHARVSVSGTTLQATADSLGRFTIAGVPSGEQMLAIHTPSLDSLNAGYSAQVTVAGRHDGRRGARTERVADRRERVRRPRLRRGRHPVGQASGRRRFDGSALGHRERRVGGASGERGGDAGRIALGLRDRRHEGTVRVVRRSARHGAHAQGARPIARAGKRATCACRHPHGSRARRSCSAKRWRRRGSSLESSPIRRTCRSAASR